MQSGIIGEIMCIVFVENVVAVLAGQQVWKVIVFPGGSQINLEITDVKLEKFQFNGMGIVNYRITLIAPVVHVDFIVLILVGQRYALKFPRFQKTFQFYFRAQSQTKG